MSIIRYVYLSRYRLPINIVLSKYVNPSNITGENTIQVKLPFWQSNSNIIQLFLKYISYVQYNTSKTEFVIVKYSIDTGNYSNTIQLCLKYISYVQTFNAIEKRIDWNLRVRHHIYIKDLARYPLGYKQGTLFFGCPKQNVWKGCKWMFRVC